MAFGGAWYPAGAEACEAQILAFGAGDASDQASPAHYGVVPGPHFGVVPHAGWVYSGSIAAGVVAALVPPDAVDVVVVLGGHLAPEKPIVAMGAGKWQTPFGPFTIHSGTREALQGLSPILWEDDSGFRDDNSTELQLPLLKYRYPHAELIVMRLPPGPLALEAGAALGAYLSAKNLRAVALASTDLTHYGPNYGFQPKGTGTEALNWVREINDQRFIKALQKGNGKEIITEAQTHQNACSAGATAALTQLAHNQQFSPTHYATSAEAGAKDRQNFVGYVGGVYG